MYKGVDVSSYQGKIDWQKAKEAGAEFAILKIIRKDLEADKQFENNWNGCAAAGVRIQGVYQYSYARTEQKAAEDAEAVLDILGKNRRPFVWLVWTARCLPTGREAAAVINAYGDVITAGGCGFGVCFGEAFDDIEQAEILPFVRRQYRSRWETRHAGTRVMKITDPVNQLKEPDRAGIGFRGWQYSDNGVVNGIEGKVCLHLCYENMKVFPTAAPEKELRGHWFGIIWESREIWQMCQCSEKVPVLSLSICK